MCGSTSKQLSWACTQFLSKSLLTLTVYWVVMDLIYQTSILTYSFMTPMVRMTVKRMTIKFFCDQSHNCFHRPSHKLEVAQIRIHEQAFSKLPPPNKHEILVSTEAAEKGRSNYLQIPILKCELIEQSTSLSRDGNEDQIVFGCQSIAQSTLLSRGGSVGGIVCDDERHGSVCVAFFY